MRAREYDLLLECSNEKEQRLPVLDYRGRRYLFKNMLRWSVYFNGFACGYRAFSSTTFAFPAAEITCTTFSTASRDDAAFSTAVYSSTTAFTATARAVSATVATVAISATKTTPERA